MLCLPISQIEARRQEHSKKLQSAALEKVMRREGVSPQAGVLSQQHWCVGHCEGRNWWET